MIRLHRERRFGNGKVTIEGIVVGDPLEKTRRASMDLAETDYERAIHAHHNSTYVEVVGSLVQRGTHTYLKNIRRFLD